MANAEKRSVSTDALETLGTIIDESAGRDAIHLAVEPVIAAHALHPGEDVGFVEGGVGKSKTPLGIVDPFLKKNVMPGERFWLVVYPRQITSLRHVWSHPAFPEAVDAPVEISGSQDFIERAAATIGVSTRDLMKSLAYYLKDCRPGMKDKVVCFGDEIDARELPEGFWAHYEAVTGTKVPDEFRDVYFRCAC